jgi:hypothetical protein
VPASAADEQALAEKYAPNAVAGIVCALLMPVVALNTVYLYADVLVRDELEPRTDKPDELPAEAVLA